MQRDDEFPLILSESFVRYWSDLFTRAGDQRRWVRLIGMGDLCLSVSLAQAEELDEEHDYLLERDGARFVVDDEVAEQFRGWQVIGLETLYEDFHFYLVPVGHISTASDPGSLTLDRDLLLAMEPELRGWRGWMWQARDRRHRTARYWSSLDSVAQQLLRGDTRAAIVLTVRPTVLVAAYSDDLDCVAVVEFPAKYARQFDLMPGSRLVTCNHYVSTKQRVPSDLKPGPLNNHRNTDFSPIIGNFLSTDTDRLQQLASNISNQEWERAKQQSEEWLVRFRAGQVWPRRATPLWACEQAGRMRMQRASLRRRTAAVTIDLLLVTSVIFSICWLGFGLAGDELTEYWRNPRNPAARAEFLEARDVVRNVTTLVYLGYATLLLISPWQGTIGKRLFDLRVVDRETFGRLSFGQALRRAFVFLMSTAAGTIGCLAMLWSKSGQTWHDDRAKTFVIHVP